MTDIAVAFSALRDSTLPDIVRWSREAEDRGFAGVFLTESFNDSLAYAEAVALSPTRVVIGTAITNIYMRHPALLAEGAAAIQELSGGRFRLGLGLGHRAVNEPLGISMDHPMRTMRETVSTLRKSWIKGPHQPRPATPPLVYLAGLRTKMLELVGATADGVILNMFPVARYAAAKEALARGAESAGRSLDRFALCHFATCYLSEDLEAARHQASRMLARYANLPFYGNMLAECGFEAEVAAIRKAWKSKDVAAAEAAVGANLVEATTLVGPAARCRERIAEWREAGATLPILFSNPVGESRADAVERMLRAFAP